MMTKIGWISFLACLSLLVYENTGQALYGVSNCEKYARNFSYLEKKIQQLEERLAEQDRTKMRPFASIGCVSGDFYKDTWPVYKSWPATEYIKFDRPFEKTPAITTGMTLLNSEYNTNVRAVIESKNITRHGFQLILRTFSDTKLWGLRASWMACPAR